MRNILKYVLKYWYFAIFAPVFMILEVLMDMYLSEYMEKMVDYGIQTSNMDNVIRYGLIMIGIVAVGVITGIMAGVFTNLCAFKFSNDLRKDVFKKIMYLSVSEADRFKTGSLITRVTNDITQIQNMVSMTLRGLVRNVSFFIMGIIFTLNISMDFGIILAILLPVEIVILVIFMRIIFPVFRTIQEKLDKVNVVVHENVDGARVVKAFTKEDYEYNRFVEVNNEYTERNLYVSKMSAFFIPFTSLLIYAAEIIIYYIGGVSIFKEYKVPGGTDTIMIGEITQAITYITMISHSVIMLGNMFTNVAKALASGKRVDEILKQKLEITDGTLDLNSLYEHGTVEFSHVCFSYEESENDILHDISFTVHQGETIAIVGSTGSGKSTLVNLIPRFYDPKSGEIRIDGRNVRDYNKKELRGLISICLQKAELFAGTIQENILYGKEKGTDEDVRKASEAAQAKEFIEIKEDGYQSQVGEKGMALSGGQKQRVSIARALIKNPEILILDDSTSALDLLTEAKLHEALKKNYPDTTKIIVAQRIATAKNAERIIVLDKGQISAFDTHENLLKTSKIYNDIYSSQLKNDTLSGKEGF